MNTKVSNKDVIWNYIGIAATMCSNFVLLPFMLRGMDSEILGLWYVYVSIGGVVTLFDFGFNPTFARNIAYSWNGAEAIQAEGAQYTENREPNFLLLSTLVKISRLIYLVLAGAAFILLLTAGTAYISHLSRNIDSTSIIISWGIYSVALFLNIYYGCYAAFLRGVGAVTDYNKINVGARGIQITVSILLLLIGKGIIAMAVSYLLYGFILRFFSRKKFYDINGIGKNIIKYKFSISKEEMKDTFMKMWHNAWRDGLVTAANYVTNQAGTLIASAFLSLTDTGIYSLTVQLVTAIVTIGAGLYSAYQPTLQAAFIVNNKKLLKMKMCLIMAVNFYIFLIGTLILTVLGPPIIRMFKPGITLQRSVIIAVAVYAFLYRRQSTYASFISNMNKVPYVFAYITSSIIGIILSGMLMKYTSIGIWGMIFGQMLPQLLYNYWRWPCYVQDYFESNTLEMLQSGSQEIWRWIKEYKR